MQLTCNTVIRNPVFSTVSTYQRDGETYPGEERTDGRSSARSAALQRVALYGSAPVPAKHIRVDIPRIPTLGIGGFFYSAIMYEAKRMLYAKRRLCVLWDFKERTLNALAFAGAQDIVSDTGCQCEQRRQHCREPDIEEDRLRPGAGEPGVRYLHKEDGA